MANHGKSGWVRWAVIVSLAAVAIAVGAFLYAKHRNAEAVQYQTATVARGDLTQAVTATGQLNPVVNVQVGSQISGRISKLYADFNSPVTQGQLIAEIDASTYQANVERAEADLTSSMASLELAQVEAGRASQLFTNKLISGSEYDSTVATLHQAEATVKIRQAALNSAKVDLARCTIFSPVDGIVISRSVDVGQTVAASMSAPILFQIANDLSKMQIDANVAEADVGGVEVGQSVEFTVDAFPYRTFRGKVKQVRNSPLTVQNVVTYDAVIEVNNDDLKLKPGMTANVSIIIQQHEDILTIPNAALRYRPPENVLPKAAGSNTVASAAQPQTAQARPAQGGSSGGRRSGQGGSGGGRRGGKAERQTNRTVYILAGDAKDAAGDVKLKPVQVKIGISDGIATEVVEGLNEGDLIVISSTGGQASKASQPASNPFGGGGGMPRRF
jgi:HlyD family secretion protein